MRVARVADAEARDHESGGDEWDVDPEDRVPARVVDERAAEHDQPSERDDVRVDGPFERVCARRQRVLDRGQGDVDDSVVEEHEKQRQAGGSERPPSPAGSSRSRPGSAADRSVTRRDRERGLSVVTDQRLPVEILSSKHRYLRANPPPWVRPRRSCRRRLSSVCSASAASPEAAETASRNPATASRSAADSFPAAAMTAA